MNVHSHMEIKSGECPQYLCLYTSKIVWIVSLRSKGREEWAVMNNYLDRANMALTNKWDDPFAVTVISALIFTLHLFKHMSNITKQWRVKYTQLRRVQSFNALGSHHQLTTDRLLTLPLQQPGGITRGPVGWDPWVKIGKGLCSHIQVKWVITAYSPGLTACVKRTYLAWIFLRSVCALSYSQWS